MKLIPLTLFLIVLMALSCRSGNPKHNKEPEVADTAKFYQVAGFFKSQIQYVDLRNFPLYQITLKDGKKDSFPINKDQFIELAKTFTDRDISAPKTKIWYRETVFQDLSTKSYTLNYSPVNENTLVKNMDVLIDEETNNVTRIFIRSVYTKGDTLVTEQCNWKAYKSFQINRSFETKNGYHSTEFNYINWNDKP